MNKYHNTIRPALIEKYSRRINNFVVRVSIPSLSCRRTRRSFTSTARRRKQRRMSCSKRSIVRRGFWVMRILDYETPRIGTASLRLLTGCRRRRIRPFFRVSMEMPPLHIAVSPHNPPIILQLLTSFGIGSRPKKYTLIT